MCSMFFVGFFFFVTKPVIKIQTIHISNSKHDIASLQCDIMAAHTFPSASLRFKSAALMAMSFHLISLARSGTGIGSPVSTYGLQASQISELAGVSLTFLFFGLPSSRTCDKENKFQNTSEKSIKNRLTLYRLPVAYLSKTGGVYLI